VSGVGLDVDGDRLHAAAPILLAGLSSTLVEAREVVPGVTDAAAGGDSVERVLLVIDGVACSVGGVLTAPEVSGHSPCFGALVLSIDVASASLEARETSL
jgi:hypothetical protein